MRTQRLGAVVATALVKEHRMRACVESTTTANDRPSSKVAFVDGCRALPARLLARLLNALHESQVRRACRELRRYRHLNQNDQGNACHGDAAC